MTDYTHKIHFLLTQRNQKSTSTTLSRILLVTSLIFYYLWIRTLQPIQTKFKKWKFFQNLLDDISLEELQNTIKQLPNQKAAGPSELNYEYIKNLNSKSLNTLCLFLFKCLQLQTIPTEWKTSNIFLIPKKSD